jgi:hypothetical protein
MTPDFRRRQSGCTAAPNPAQLRERVSRCGHHKAEVGYRLKSVKGGRCLEIDVQHCIDSAETPAEADQLKDLL